MNIGFINPKNLCHFRFVMDMAEYGCILFHPDVSVVVKSDGYLPYGEVQIDGRYVIFDDFISNDVGGSYGRVAGKRQFSF